MGHYLIPAFYGSATLGALALAAWSRNPTATKVALLLLLAWVGCNLIVEVNGVINAPLLLPIYDAILGVCVGVLAVANRSRAATSVFALFVMVAAVHVIAFSTHAQGTYRYYLTLNLLFLAQVLAIGGVSAWALVADRSRRSHLRAYRHLASG